ncbi:Plasmodium exported protein, unknown function [Plasmodium vivax]|uniref:Fam-l protein n=1 Tax=Plasmodium vivax TaxID=5855 RepID=A0A564ZPR7_PLAVI|nr:Plasmodium exported protein, unknown function [Plasmodium vivax]
MQLLGYYKMNHNVNLAVLLLFFSFTYLIWIPTNYMCILSNDFEMKFNHDRTSNRHFNRLLAKLDSNEELDNLPLRGSLVNYGMSSKNTNEEDVISTYGNLKKRINHDRTSNRHFNRLLAKLDSNEELDNLPLRGSLVNYGMSSKNTNEEDVISTYGNLKKRRRINLYDHKKGYKNRYSKKKGLAKLDCYCEKILFDKFDYLYKIAEKRKNSRISFMEKILNRYGYRLILFSLIPIIGLIFPALFCKKDEHAAFLALFCEHQKHVGTDYKDCKAKILTETEWAYLKVFYYINIIIFCFIIPTIYLSMLIYGFIKVVKYERLKSGKDKMSFKEYCRFCKDLF